MTYYLGLMAIAAMSITGVIAAGKKGMDIISIILLGVVTAIGGGTLRDIILDTNPIFWIADLSYLWTATGAAIFAFFLVPHVKQVKRLLLYADAFGLSLFGILAVERTLNYGFSAPVAVLMGIVTGIAGGILRDLLTIRMPLLTGREFYVTPILLGSTTFAVLDIWMPGMPYIRPISIGVIFVFRASAIQWGLYYPDWLMYKRGE
jgi:uncharacterized membrane protein YeiH